MKYRIFVVAVILLAITGYGTYTLYPRFAMNPNQISLLLLAVAAGFASFFSPCSFSLMAGLLVQETGVKDGVSSTSIQRGFLFASSLAIGATLFFALAALGLILGGSALFSSITFTSTIGRIIRIITGSVLIALGLMQLEVLPNILDAITNISAPLMRYQARYRRKTPSLGFLILGFAYPMAGFG